MKFIKKIGSRLFSKPKKQSVSAARNQAGGDLDELRYSAEDLGIPLSEVSPAAMLVCETLQNHGYDGYLVGGCVRDWILGLHPKDFDVATNATPEQIKPLFKRARIIGRRFKLVHVHHQREMIEVATYRSAPSAEKGGKAKESRQASSHNSNRRVPRRHQKGGGKSHQQSQSGRLLRDNVYGTLLDDAERRDFTINGLYLDPIAGEVVDFQNGVEDVQDRVLAVIGDPELRFAEDPVRMLRALRFKAKLDLHIPDDIDELIHQNKYRFAEVSNARLFDETFKLFHHAHARASWDVLSEYGFEKVLFPLTAKAIDAQSDAEDFIYRALDNTDRRVGKGLPVIPAFFFAVILWHPYQHARKNMENLPRGRAGVYQAADEVYRKQFPTIAIPKRVSGVITEIWDMQWNLETRRPKFIESILDNRRFRAAYDFLLLRESIGEVDSELTRWWTEIQNKDEAGEAAMIDALPQFNAHKNKGKRRRKPRKPSNQGS
ncbi:MAG: polynucleotide adenylyltransferase PcnB [Arenicellales bacterium]